MSGSAATGGRKSATTEAIAQWAVATATIATTAQWAEAQEWTVKATLIAGIAIGIAAITIATAGAISMTIAAGGASKFASSTRTVTSIAATDNHGKWQKTTISVGVPESRRHAVTASGSRVRSASKSRWRCFGSGGIGAMIAPFGVTVAIS